MHKSTSPGGVVPWPAPGVSYCCKSNPSDHGSDSQFPQIADPTNQRVRKVSNGVITTIAGNGSKDFGGDGGSALNSGLFTPTEIAFGPDRKLYVLDVDHARIRRIDLVSGTISTVAGNGEPTASGDGGPPLGAGLGAPRGLAIDSAGNLYVTDVKSGRLRIVRPARNRISLPPD